MENYKIRLASKDDAEAVRLAHVSSVQEVASKDYSQDIVNEWCKGPCPEAAKRFGDAIDEGREIVWVAEIDSKVVGFSTLVPKFGEVRAVYVSGSAIGSGVGSKLLNALENEAKKRNISKLTLVSTISAKIFYEKNGFKNLGESLHSKRSGNKMICYKMEKILS